MNEFDLIKNYFGKIVYDKKTSLSLNDDVFFDKSRQLVISVDTYIEGVHFYNFKKPDLVIKKILRSSLSDLICKGLHPKYFFISGSGNNYTFSKSNLKKITKSLKSEQKKYNIFLSGGDTVKSNKLSFTFSVVGFSKKIIYRNRAKANDDIYVTGNLGDSYMGLQVLKKKIKLDKKLRDFFVKKYYLPDLQIILAKKLFKFANTTIDISDGLITDLEKLINKQKLSYKLSLSKIPISNKLKTVLNKNNRFNLISVISRGDDYQILFTASPKKSGIIKKFANLLGIKISKIGKINKKFQKSSIIDEKGNKININLKGYYHKF